MAIPTIQSIATEIAHRRSHRLHQPYDYFAQAYTALSAHRKISISTLQLPGKTFNSCINQRPHHRPKSYMQSHSSSSSHKIKVKHNPRNPTKALQNLQHGAGFNFDPIGSGYRKERDKGKGRARDEDDEGEDDGVEGGRFTLLALPHTLIPQILSLLPPRSLLPLRLTSSLFSSIIDEDTLWRDSYVNRFFSSWGEGSSSVLGLGGYGWTDGGVNIDRENEAGWEVATGLVRSCVGGGSGGGGWKREALSRESMLDRFIYSKAPTIVHNAHIDLLTSLSLFYTPPQQQPMPVRYGHAQSTPVKSSSIQNPLSPARTPPILGSNTTNPTAGPSTPTSTSTTKLIGAKHRQPHRSPGSDPTGFGGTGGMGRSPNTLCVGMNAGVAVRGDPLVGKSLQGWLGPGQIPTLGHVAPIPQCSFTPTLNPGFVLWGLRSGHVMLSTLLNPLPHPGRLSGPIIACSNEDAHAMPVRTVWAPPLDRGQAIEDQMFISGAEDGKIKIWRHDQPIKKNGHGPGTAGSLICTFTSPVISKFGVASNSTASFGLPRPFGGRSDPVVLVRWERDSNIIVVGTESGGLWLLTGFEDGTPSIESTLHCLLEGTPGQAEPSRLEFYSEPEANADDDARLLTVLLHVKDQSTVDRLDYRTLPDGTASLIGRRVLGVPGNSASILSLHVEFDIPPSISLPTSLVPGDFSAEVSTGGAAADFGIQPMSSESKRSTDPLSQAPGIRFLRFIVAGCQDGMAHIWTWESPATRIGPKESDTMVCPIRSWVAGEGVAITSVTSSRSLVGTGDAHGNVNIWDALERRPILLRTLRNRHAMTPTVYPPPGSIESLTYSVNAIILEADMVVASVGPHVIGWRAGNRKTKDGKNAWKGQVLGKHSSGKTSPAKGYDAKHLKSVVAESKSEIEAEQDEVRAYHQREALIRCELDTVGLEDPEEAFQYALMISQEETSRRGSSAASDADQVDDSGLQEALEAIRRAEAAESAGSTLTSASASTPVSLASEASGDGGITRIRYSELTEEQELAVALEQIKLAEELEASLEAARIASNRVDA